MYMYNQQFPQQFQQPVPMQDERGGFVLPFLAGALLAAPFYKGAFNRPYGGCAYGYCNYPYGGPYPYPYPRPPYYVYPPYPYNPYYMPNSIAVKYNY